MKCIALVVFAATINMSFGLTLRNKRQSEDDNNLEDRYGWDRPQSSWSNSQRPRPNQSGNQWPGFTQFPNQGGNQFPNQGGNQFPNQGGNGQSQQQNQWPGQNQGGQPMPTPAPNSNGSTTQSDAVQECIRNCPVTSEYNPVCGTNMVQYPNPGRLTCAQNCGVRVSLFRSSACPLTTTAAPADS